MTSRTAILAPGDVVLVTGASTGLGLAITKRLLAEEPQLRLVLAARESSLGRFAAQGIRESENCWLRPLNVRDKGQQVALIDEVDERWGGVDVLINNAGVAYRSVVEHVDEEERLAQMQINFLAPLALTRRVLPRMRAKRRGRILNISSVSGMMAMPTMSIYSASKWALEGATEALWYEVRPWNIRVTLVEPGFIHSPSFRNTRYTKDSRRSEDDVHDPYHAHYEYMAPFIEKVMARAWATPEKVAARVHRLMRRKRPPLRAPVTIDAHVFYLLRRMLPRPLYHWLLYRSLPHVDRWGPAENSIAPEEPEHT